MSLSAGSLTVDENSSIETIYYRVNDRSSDNLISFLLRHTVENGIKIIRFVLRLDIKSNPLCLSPTPMIMEVSFGTLTQTELFCTFSV